MRLFKSLLRGLIFSKLRVQLFPGPSVGACVTSVLFTLSCITVAGSPL